MLRRRRRPLLRAAAVGGAGYALAKRHRGADDEGEAGVPESPDGGGPQEDGPQEDGGSPRALDAAGLEELEKLAELKKSGVLTQEEFEDQKHRLLQGS